MTSLESKIIFAISYHWTPYSDIARDVLRICDSSMDLHAKLAELTKSRKIWRSYEATLIDGKPVMVTRYCLAHDVGDPPIGRRVRPAMMEMAE